MNELTAIDSLCQRYDLDVLEVLDAAAEIDYPRNQELGVYATQAIIADVGWISDSVIDDLYEAFRYDESDRVDV